MWSKHGGGIENIGKYGGKPVHLGHSTEAKREGPHLSLYT